MDTAFYYYTCVTDLVRKNMPPRIKNMEKGMFASYLDFVNECKIRYAGIKKDYPEAEFIETGNGVCIFVQGVMVYERYILDIDETPVIVHDDDAEDGYGHEFRK